MALTCRIALDKKNGLTLTVEDPEAKTQQTVVLDGKTIVLTCKDQENTSTITQKSDGITVKCKAFAVDAETISLKSQKDTTVESQQKLTLKSQDDAALSSQAGVTIEAKQDLSLSGNNVSGKGTQKASLAAMQVSVSGDQKVEVKGATVAVSADMKLDVKGTVAKIASDGVLEVSGQMLKLSGQLIDLQAPVIKLG